MGLVRVAVFILQTITAKPKLATKLNGPADLKLSLRGRFNVPGSLADFLIVSFFFLVARAFVEADLLSQGLNSHSDRHNERPSRHSLPGAPSRRHQRFSFSEELVGGVFDEASAALFGFFCPVVSSDGRWKPKIGIL